MIQKLTFGIRLILFVLVPVFHGTMPYETLMIAITILLLTLLVDFFSGATLWISARWETLTMYIVYLGLLTLALLAHPTRPVSLLGIIPLLLIALSSDAISNSHRWKLLLPTMGILVIYLWFSNIMEFRSPPGPSSENAFMAWYFLIYSLIPVIASLARLFFPRTKNLIHTSLDYPPLRLELLSMGMKRLAAIGLKKL